MERASYEAQRAERRYRAVDPDNRLVARGLEREWEACLKRWKPQRPILRVVRPLAPIRSAIRSVTACSRSDPISSPWIASTTTPRDRKELLRTLLDEVIVKVDRDACAAHLTLRWKGGALTEIDLGLPRSRPATIRTDEDTVALLRRLAMHYPDAVIADILNRQGRATAYGHRFDRNRVGNLRRHWKIPNFQDKPQAAGDLLNIKQAAAALGVAPSTIHRLLNDGIIAGEQLTPGAPWRIRLTDELKARFNGETSDDFLPMREAMRALGVPRQTVLQRVKRGELEAVHVVRGKQKGLRIKVLAPQSNRFDQTA
ncbi:helix-turn-helix domain-containing protein [Bradyrhizobium sp. 76]|uniref:helix-turn-helix domain-containing protein n=1 Tax=Bradyrhizobium sp. 76 TaxID=2782680 RepID=UPI001FF84CF5|nr:helix-turn-helix domain-containing protein [Bradyrhizobium sp. 76]